MHPPEHVPEQDLWQESLQLAEHEPEQDEQPLLDPVLVPVHAVHDTVLPVADPVQAVQDAVLVLVPVHVEQAASWVV